MGCPCCGGSSKEKDKKEYVCAVNPEKCPTKIVGTDDPVPECCGKPMKAK